MAQFYLTALAVFKVVFTAVVTAMIGFALAALLCLFGATRVERWMAAPPAGIRTGGEA